MELRLIIGTWGIVAFGLLLGPTVTYSQSPARQATPSEKAATEPAVVAIRIVRESDGKVLAESPLGISVEIGKPLDRERVAESLRALYRTGDYADLKSPWWLGNSAGVAALAGGAATRLGLPAAAGPGEPGPPRRWVGVPG